jgi:hypothetical protein
VQILPGPGEYNTNDSSFPIMTRPNNYQYFGSNVERFKEVLLGTEIGPGHYNISTRRRSTLSDAATSGLKSKVPRELFDLNYLSLVPGPGEYTSEKHLKFS